jgi:four helix bundle protein
VGAGEKSSEFGVGAGKKSWALGARSRVTPVGSWESGVMSKEEKPREETFDFENLKVYQKALDYVDLVYEITKAFPKAELFSLSDQFKRASTSICLNIAEGSGGSRAEFIQFLKISRRSVRECVAITDISFRQAFVDTQDTQRSRDRCLELSKMLNGLIKSLQLKEPINV